MEREPSAFCLKVAEKIVEKRNNEKLSICQNISNIYQNNDEICLVTSSKFMYTLFKDHNESAVITREIDLGLVSSESQRINEKS